MGAHEAGVEAAPKGAAPGWAAPGGAPGGVAAAGSLFRGGSPGAPPAAQAAGDGSAAARAAEPGPSFLEVRIGPDRVEVVEFLSHDRADALGRRLASLGLVLSEDFKSPCG